MTLANAFHGELWTGHLNRNSFPNGYFGDIKPLSLQAFDSAPFWLKLSRICSMWYEFARFPSRNPSYTIFSGSLSLLAYKKITGPKILYCHTPPRLLYDLKDFYISQTDFLYRPAMSVLMHFYKKAYEDAIKAMDLIIANSGNVQKRIKKYLSMDSVVVYPPCDTEGFRWLGQKDYYISTARVDLLKRVDIIIKAFLKMPDKKLVVVSGGSELRRIRDMAQDASNISIPGWVNEKKLRDLMGNSIASIYIPRDEDFGISPVESMAAGKPVIGVAEGGMTETVEDGKTGILIRSCPSPDDVMNAVMQMTPERAGCMRKNCEVRALGFRKEIFVKKMRQIILNHVGHSKEISGSL